MPNSDTTFAFNPVWDELGDILEIIAILKSIEEEKEFIDAQARRANPWDVAVNLHQILGEVSRMETDLRKIRAHLDRLYGVTEKRIYQQKHQEQEANQGQLSQVLEAVEQQQKANRAQLGRVLEVVEQRLLEYQAEQESKEMGNGNKNGRGAKLPKDTKRKPKPKPRPKYRGNRT